MVALRADNIVDLDLHQLVQHPEPDTDAQREQPVLRGVHELLDFVLVYSEHPAGFTIIAVTLSPASAVDGHVERP